ncbi:uncharacterized protein [Malus domestica]|uniref:uncharacterized protein n=1 Tax=Malus domestica TaxID=3750 RepID=UPI0039756242
MAQYQTSRATADAEMNAEEAEFENSIIQYQHHAKSSHHGFVTRRSFVQRDREECHDQMMKDYFIEHSRYSSHDFRIWFQIRKELFESILNADSTDKYCQLVENTTIENLKRFCKAIEAIYGATYLRKPNHKDLK